ncbi:hypothetical protein [Erythrobacter aureus]|uniref:Uncharacterized protein n=1 Tax=Erythrobacter aureus TaxID=2182384 RepID=A0A345YIL3_9SPHN|nr:hypothetical protein [Erythrobacter aureus]AXK43765.1 hypothetical protein DVR09_15020 [Erythrobacter aureus]
MSQTPTSRRVIVRAPITMSIGPVPESVQSTEQFLTFGIANLQAILKDKGITAKVDADQIIATVVDGSDKAETFTANGLKMLDERAYRVQTNGDAHNLEFSTDTGNTFNVVGTFSDETLANAIGTAWVDGRVESVG